MGQKNANPQTVLFWSVPTPHPHFYVPGFLPCQQISSASFGVEKKDGEPKVH